MRITQSLVRAATVAATRVGTIDGDRRRTWGEIIDRVSRYASGLASRSHIADRIAILAHNSDAYFESYFAVLWAGQVLVPLNTRLTPTELRFQLKDAGVRGLLFGAEFADLALQFQKDGVVSYTVAMEGPHAGAPDRDALIGEGQPLEETMAEDRDLAGIFFTGGTTGRPKGVMLSHGNLHTMAVNLLMSIPFDDQSVILHAAPMFHLADIGMLIATMAGAAHVFRKTYDVESMLADMQANQVSHCFTVPIVLERIARAVAAGGHDLSSVRMLGYGGSAMPAAALDLVRTTFPAVDLVQGFGQTEMPAATFLSAPAHRAGANPEKLKSAGQPCLGYELKVLDEDGVEVPRRTVGEIVGRGGNVMMGYWHRPEETREALRGGWLHTGDTGYQDEDGYIYIVDRLKDMIVSGAENVYSLEVENALNWHPGVRESAVIGLPDATWGERVHAVVVLEDGQAAVSFDELNAFCREQIAGYKCPKSFEISPVPLPRNAAGKILKAPLREAAIKTPT